jgi:peptide/nickel transport system permease protein
VSRRTRFIARRLLLTIPVLFVMSVIVFSIVRLIPGDPAHTMLGFHATPTAVAEINRQLRLDDPLPVQYWHWIVGVLQGDLGIDFVSREQVSHLITSALPVTLELAIGSLLVGVALGLPIGILAARGRRAAKLGSDGFVVAGTAIPDFWMGLMLVLLFSTTLALLPPSGYVSLAEDPGLNVQYFLLPVLALGIGQAAYFARVTRAAVEDALRAPYVLLLRAKGVSERGILWRHALRNAAPPIVTVIGIQFGVLLGGAIVIETLFSLPGEGRMLVSAIGARNYVVVQGAVLVIATLFILVNLLTDLIVGMLDPRIADSAAQ